MRQTALSLEKPAQAPQDGPLLMRGSVKMGLIVLLLAVLWLRLSFRRRSKDKVCSHCGRRNPPHRSHCTNCSAPLFEA